MRDISRRPRTPLRSQSLPSGFGFGFGFVLELRAPRRPNKNPHRDRGRQSSPAAMESDPRGPGAARCNAPSTRNLGPWGSIQLQRPQPSLTNLLLCCLEDANLEATTYRVLLLSGSREACAAAMRAGPGRGCRGAG
jgi:hypothetical protein